MYNSKTIQNLKPQWYLDLSKKEKLKEQNRLKDERAEMWNDKPVAIKPGSKLIAKLSTKSITENNYK